MKRLISVLLVVLIAAQYASAVSMRKRRQADPAGQEPDLVDSMISMVGMTENLPFIGTYMKSARTWMGDTAGALGDMNNGMMARALGGAMPCEIDIDTGITCTGVSEDTMMVHRVMEIVQQSPLPNIIQKAIASFFSWTLEPLFNILFGGVALKSAS